MFTIWLCSVSKRKHWEAVGDDQYKVIDESGYGVASNCNWGWNNCTIQREEYLENRTALDDKYESIKDASTTTSKKIMFTTDLTLIPAM